MHAAPLMRTYWWSLCGSFHLDCNVYESFNNDSNTRHSLSPCMPTCVALFLTSDVYSEVDWWLENGCHTDTAFVSHVTALMHSLSLQCAIRGHFHALPVHASLTAICTWLPSVRAAKCSDQRFCSCAHISQKLSIQTSQNDLLYTFLGRVSIVFWPHCDTMYFWFCGWRYVFHITARRRWCELGLIQRAAAAARDEVWCLWLPCFWSARRAVWCRILHVVPFLQPLTVCQRIFFNLALFQRHAICIYTQLLTRR